MAHSMSICLFREYTVLNLNHLARLVSEKTEKKIKDTELNRQELPIIKPGTI